MSTVLLGGNVLVALVLADHVHRERCRRWFSGVTTFATCSVTEGTLLRVHMRCARDSSAVAAWKTLAAFHRHPGHQFWGENFSYLELDSTRITGHRQITDSWLVHLARSHSARLATLDEGLAVLWPEVVDLIPV